MTKWLATMDTTLIEVHFARETAMFERFSVTTPGWQSVWLMTKYHNGYAKHDECMIRTEAIVWSRNREVQVWFEIDEANLIPIRKADKRDVMTVVNHVNHIEFTNTAHGVDDGCSVTGHKIDGFGWAYRIKEGRDDGPVLSEVR